MTAFRAAFKAYRMHQVLILPRFARLTFALGLVTVLLIIVELTVIRMSVTVGVVTAARFITE